jgi:type IV pilus assembly protein PilC
MLIVGEETGKIDETMDRISKYFETQADEKVKRLSTAIEPIILVFLGIGVAFVVLSIVLPMYSLTESF